MKKLLSIFSSIRFSFLALVLIGLLQTSTVFAARSGSPDVAQTLIAIYNNALRAVSELLYSPDLQLPKVISATQTLTQAAKTSSTNLNDSLANFIEYYFSDTNKKDALLFSAINYKTAKAGDDFDDVSAIKDFNELFTKKVTKENAAGGGIGADSTALLNAKLNASSLLSTEQYQDDKQAADARLFIGYIENVINPPNFIHVSKSFAVPYPSTDKKTKIVLSNLQGLRDTLESSPVYRQYKLNYRAQIAARTMLLSNLLRMYQDRIAAGKEKSTEQARFDEANWRLQDPTNPSSYYQEMQVAPPATVQREMLFLLVEIHRDLYNLHTQNQQLILLQTLAGLESLSASAKVNTPLEAIVAKIIYCYADKANTPAGHKLDANCANIEEEGRKLPLGYQ
jgi:hypothetical protein